jgi:hypothetical protein
MEAWVIEIIGRLYKYKAKKYYGLYKVEKFKH